MKTKYYYIEWMRLGRLLIIILGLISIFLLIIPMRTSWASYLFKGAALLQLIISILGFLVTHHAIGINDKYLVVKRSLGTLRLTWEAISDFVPLYTSSRGTTWAIYSSELPVEYKLLAALSIRTRKPFIGIGARTDEQFEMLREIREHMEATKVKL